MQSDYQKINVFFHELNRFTVTYNNFKKKKKNYQLINLWWNEQLVLLEKFSQFEVE